MRRTQGPGGQAGRGNRQPEKHHRRHQRPDQETRRRAGAEQGRQVAAFGWCGLIGVLYEQG